MKNKNILITGSNGFIGFNLKTVLIENGFKVLEFKKQNSLSFLKKQTLLLNFHKLVMLLIFNTLVN